MSDTDNLFEGHIQLTVVAFESSLSDWIEEIKKEFDEVVPVPMDIGTMTREAFSYGRKLIWRDSLRNRLHMQVTLEHSIAGGTEWKAYAYSKEAEVYFSYIMARYLNEKSKATIEPDFPAVVNPSYHSELEDFLIMLRFFSLEMAANFPVADIRKDGSGKYFITWPFVLQLIILPDGQVRVYISSGEGRHLWNEFVGKGYFADGKYKKRAFDEEGKADKNEEILPVQLGAGRSGIPTFIQDMIVSAYLTEVKLSRISRRDFLLGHTVDDLLGKYFPGNDSAKAKFGRFFSSQPGTSVYATHKYEVILMDHFTTVGNFQHWIKSYKKRQKNE